MATRHTNYMKAKVWTPTMTSECEGSPDAVIPMAFYALTTPERRAKCIAALEKIHAEVTRHENVRPLEPTGATK